MATSIADSPSPTHQDDVVTDGRDNSSRLLAEEKEAHKNTRSQLTSRDEFLAIVSHDLRNPLGTIASAAEAILQESNPEAIKQYAEMVKRNADLALRLINDLLDVERIASGKLALDLAMHNIQDLIAASVKGFELAAAAKSISIRVASSGQATAAYCDADRILQVLSNIVGNAIKFTSIGGRVELQIENDSAYATVSVNDSGPGIPESKLTAIFERFSQLQEPGRHGLGLGLYISRQIIEAHHGRLWVESDLGQGSKFSFTLPLGAKH